MKFDVACCKQQIEDGCFPSLDAVPKTAMTITIPGLLEAERILCAALGYRTAAVVRDVLVGPIITSCSTNVLQTKHGIVFYAKRS